jgi:hypothetical protein
MDLIYESLPDDSLYNLIICILMIRYFNHHQNYWVFSLCDIYIIVKLDYLIFKWCSLYINNIVLYTFIFLSHLMLNLDTPRPYTYEILAKLLSLL